MARTSVEVNAAPEAVWSVLADPSAYGEWVVGTKEVVRADSGWPEPGSQLSYELGVGPIAVGDRTTVVEAEPPRLLVLRAELRALGAVSIRLRLEPAGSATLVVMDETPAGGVLEAAHTAVADAALERRNRLSLGRLKRLAEARA